MGGANERLDCLDSPRPSQRRGCVGLGTGTSRAQWRPFTLRGATAVAAGIMQLQLTRRYYESNAEAYAAETVGADMLPLIARFVDKLRPGSLVIDLGCGSGRDLRSFSALGFRPIGLDYAEPLARYAHRTTSLPLVIADLRRLPCRSSAVDGAWAAASLLHLRRRELMQALTEIRRVLKPGAPFFASLKRGTGGSRDATSRWFTYFEPAEWNAVLRTAGFVDIEVGEDRESRPRPGTVTAVDWLVSFARTPHAGSRCSLLESE